MNRRLFFQALAGAPVAALPLTPQVPKTPEIAEYGFTPVCAECGYVGAVESGNNSDQSKQFFRCFNEECRMYRVAISVPIIRHPTKLADPKLVAEADERFRLCNIEYKIKNKQPKWSQFWADPLQYPEAERPNQKVVMEAFLDAHESWCMTYNRTDDPNWY